MKGNKMYTKLEEMKFFEKKNEKEEMYIQRELSFLFICLLGRHRGWLHDLLE